MQTSPAPLEGMNAALEEFRIGSPRDVGLLLKQLLDGAVVLSLHGSDGSVFRSAIWTMDSAPATIGFNADPNDPAMQSILHSHEVTVVGYLDSVKVQFEIRNPVLVHGNRASVLSCPFPREMYRFQRRNAFRVRPLMRSGRMRSVTIAFASTWPRAVLIVTQSPVWMPCSAASSGSSSVKSSGCSSESQVFQRDIAPEVWCSVRR